MSLGAWNGAISWATVGETKLCPAPQPAVVRAVAARMAWIVRFMALGVRGAVDMERVNGACTSGRRARRGGPRDPEGRPRGALRRRGPDRRAGPAARGGPQR